MRMLRLLDKRKLEEDIPAICTKLSNFSQLKTTTVPTSLSVKYVCYLFVKDSSIWRHESITPEYCREWQQLQRWTYWWEREYGGSSSEVGVTEGGTG